MRFLWRRRKWRHIRKLDHPGPNWAEITTVILTAGIVLASFVQAYIYWKQAQIMQSSLSQNERSILLGHGQLIVAARNAQTAEDTLREMKSGGSDTRTLAESTKSSAQTAKEALHISERAYITWSNPVLHIARKMITIPITNAGRIPSGRVTAIIYEDTMTVPAGQVGEAVRAFRLDRHKSIINITSVPPSSTPVSSLEIPVEFVDLSALQHSTQKIQLVGTITYNDGFAGSPIQKVLVCINNIYNEVAKEVNIVACDGTNILPGYESMDWTGPGMTNTMNQ